jgi:hypothetical protein
MKKWVKQQLICYKLNCNKNHQLLLQKAQAITKKMYLQHFEKNVNIMENIWENTQPVEKHCNICYVLSQQMHETTFGMYAHTYHAIVCTITNHQHTLHQHQHHHLPIGIPSTVLVVGGISSAPSHVLPERSVTFSLAWSVVLTRCRNEGEAIRHGGDGGGRRLREGGDRGRQGRPNDKLASWSYLAFPPTVSVFRALRGFCWVAMALVMPSNGVWPNLKRQ